MNNPLISVNQVNKHVNKHKGHNKHFISLLFTLPPRGIWRRIKKRTWQYNRRVHIRISGASQTGLNFRTDLAADIPNGCELIQRIKEGPYPAFFVNDQKKEWTAQQFRDLCPGEEENVIRAADLACRHVFDLLGSGPCHLGSEIDWQLDFKSGYSWDQKAFYLDLYPAPYPGGYDIKVPWELSRCQHFAWLGQAYWLSGNEVYAREFCAQVKSWITNNPPQMGVNWVCTMDVAIRTINWLWGIAYFRHSPSLSDEFHVLFYRSMLEHGQHIFNNLEYSENLTSNHYLSDIVGLVYLGFLLPELKDAHKWREFGLHELESEMFKQVYPDGVDFEASTNYHRLVTELFLSATMLAQENGISFSPKYIARLERMIEATRLIMRPDGTIPIIGDQDNGRLHRLKIWGNPAQEWNNFCPQLVVGDIWMQKPFNMQFLDSDLTEAFWLAGPDAVRQFQQMQQSIKPRPAISTLLPEGGWAILRDHDHYLMLDAGSVGQNGQGGHAHNDSLSIDVFASGEPWIVDPGTFVYTADYKARHAFRLTRAHNTIYINGYEQSQIDAKLPFLVKTPSKTRIVHWETNDHFSLIVAEVQYAGSQAITHRRGVLYDLEAGAWLVADWVFPAGLEARIHLNFSPGIKAEGIEVPFRGIQLHSNSRKCFWICSMQGEKPEITPNWISNAYGVKQESLQAEFHFAGNPIHFLTLLPEESGKEVGTRIQTLLKTWEYSQGASYLFS